MSRQPAIYLIAICAIVVILVTGCTQAQSDFSRDELPAKLLDALLEEKSYVSDVRVLKYISFENRNYVLYYYKVGRMEN